MNLNAEQSLIGAVLVRPEELGKCDDIQPDMFIDPLLRRIFRVCQQLYDAGQAVNVITISQRISDVPRDTLGEIFKDCADSCIAGQSAESYAEAVRSAYIARQASQAVNAVQFTPADADRQIGELITSLESLRTPDRTGPKSLSQIISEEKPRHFTDMGGHGLNTGFPLLDDCLGGLEGGDIAVIGARPAVGKSAFVTQLMLQVAQQGKRVVLFNLEMREAQVYERIVASRSGIPLSRVRRALAFQGDERERYEETNASVSKLDVWISSGRKRVSTIRAECRHLDADLIIVDYLQLIEPDRKYGNRASEVGDISKSLKGLAMELGVPIVVLSQLNRLSEARETKEPSMAELRESGDIEQDASVVLLLWNLSEDERNRRGLKIEKSRQGKTGKFELSFDGDAMTFREVGILDTNFKKVRKKTPFD